MTVGGILAPSPCHAPPLASGRTAHAPDTAAASPRPLRHQRPIVVDGPVRFPQKVSSDFLGHFDSSPDPARRPEHAPEINSEHEPQQHHDRRSLALYDLLLAARDNGEEIIIRSRDGEKKLALV